MNSLYGNYRTRSFSEIFPDFDGFNSFYTSCGIPTKLTVDTVHNKNYVNLTYLLLLSEYANSHISSSDEDRFKLNVMSIIFRFGPTWEYRLELQDKIRGLSDAELLEGATAINNMALNPETAPTTTTASELDYINEQRVTKYKKGKMDAYASVDQILRSDVSGEYIGKFKKLFNQFPEEVPLWYETELEDN